MSISDRKYIVEIKINLAFKCLLLVLYKLVVESICLLPLCLYLDHRLPFDEENDGSMGWVLSLLLWSYGLRDIILFPCLLLPELSLFFLPSFTYREGRCRGWWGLAIVHSRGHPAWNFNFLYIFLNYFNILTLNLKIYFIIK